MDGEEITGDDMDAEQYDEEMDMDGELYEEMDNEQIQQQ